MSRLERRIAAANPHASNLSTRERDKAAKKQAKEARKSAARRAGHHAEVSSGSWRPRWPFQW